LFFYSRPKVNNFIEYFGKFRNISYFYATGCKIVSAICFNNQFKKIRCIF
jgi:hypothetical protein